MKTPTQIQNLVGFVTQTYPAAHFEYDPLPSGVCFFWVTLNGRNFVLEYHPTEGTGVSENLADTPPFVGHDEVFPKLGDAVNRFQYLLADAEAHPVEIASAYALHDKSR